MKLSGTITQIIPPEDIGGYAVPDEIYREAVEHGYSVAVIKTRPHTIWEKLIKYLPPLWPLLGIRHDHPFHQHLLVYNPSFEEGDEIQIQAEPVMVQLENTYRVKNAER